MGRLVLADMEMLIDNVEDLYMNAYLFGFLHGK